MPELSPIFSLSDQFVSESAALDPYSATSRGIPGFDHLATDFSPDGCQARVDHVRRSIAQLRQLQPLNDDDRLAKDFLTERFDVIVAVHDSGEWMRPLRALAAPVVTIRSAFDLMPRDGEQAWQNIAARVHAVAGALDGLRASLQAGRSADIVASQRQTEVVAAQCATWADDRWFDSLRAEAEQRSDVSPSTIDRLATGSNWVGSRTPTIASGSCAANSDALCASSSTSACTSACAFPTARH